MHNICIDHLFSVVHSVMQDAGGNLAKILDEGTPLKAQV